MNQSTSIPRDFEAAYEALVELVGRISSDDVAPPAVREEVNLWQSSYCRGAATLAEATLKALRYELASAGLVEGAGSMEDKKEALQALARVESILRPPPQVFESTGENGQPEIVEVGLPDQLRRQMPKGRGFRMGEFQIIFEPHQGPPHGHLSISHPSRYPAFEELQDAAGAPGGPAPNLWALIPKPQQRQSMTGKTVHLYVMPPQELLG